MERGMMSPHHSKLPMPPSSRQGGSPPTRLSNRGGALSCWLAKTQLHVEPQLTFTYLVRRLRDRPHL